MSTYVMACEDIAPIVEFAVQHNLTYRDGHHWRKADKATADALGQLLVNANVKSVNYRYRENEPAPKYQHKAPHKIARRVRTGPDVDAFLAVVADAVECLDYQACEPDDWRQSDAFAFLASVNAKLVRMLAQRVSR